MSATTETAFQRGKVTLAGPGDAMRGWAHVQAVRYGDADGASRQSSTTTTARSV